MRIQEPIFVAGVAIGIGNLIAAPGKTETIGKKRIYLGLHKLIETGTTVSRPQPV